LSLLDYILEPVEHRLPILLGNSTFLSQLIGIPLDMICLTCHRPTPGTLCDRCRATLRPARERVLPGGIRLVSAFEHTGAATELIHHLKYRGLGGYPELVAEMIAPRLSARPLVPVPRAWSRRLKHGVDPALEIAAALARRLDVPVLRMLRARVHSPRRAGRDHSRVVRSFEPRGHVRDQVILVDDVFTTGATVSAAITSLGIDRVLAVVTANDASSGSILMPSV